MNPIVIFIFVTGLSRLAVFDVGGQLYGTDLLLIASFFVLINRFPKYLQRGPVLLLLILGALWLLNAIITDIYRGTPFQDWSRGWAKIVFFLLDLFGFIVLTQLKFSRISAFAAGMSLAYLIEPDFFPNQYLVDFAPAWKFGYSPALTTFAALLGTNVFVRRRFGIAGETLPLALLGVVNLLFNYRSMFGIATMAAGFGILKHALDISPKLRAKITPALFVALIGGALVLSQGLIVVYETAADNGWLGPDAKDKYLAQTSGSLGLLESGRSEWLVSTQAIADTPIVGHGSWAKDVAYIALWVDILESRGVQIQGDLYESMLIPTHSHLLGSWVEAGIMGGVFWLAVMGICIKAIYITLRKQIDHATFIAFFLFFLIWDVVFSPFGAEQRFIKSLEIGIALMVLGHARNNSQQEWRNDARPKA